MTIKFTKFLLTLLFNRPLARFSWDDSFKNYILSRCDTGVCQRIEGACDVRKTGYFSIAGIFQ